MLAYNLFTLVTFDVSFTMKKLCVFLALLCLLFSTHAQAQSSLKNDLLVDPVLKKVALGQPDLVAFGRTTQPNHYINMAVLDKTRKVLTWFDCYGVAYDSLQLSETDYLQIAAQSTDPFSFYVNLYHQKIEYAGEAIDEYRRLGKDALSDTSGNWGVIYNSLQVRSAQSSLQQLMAIEGFQRRAYLQLSMFESPSPSSILSRKDLLVTSAMAGKMINWPDSVIYYANNSMSTIAKIRLFTRENAKMYVYDVNDQLVDSVPLRPERQASLMNCREDVFLLYRGWLEMQYQEISNALEYTRARIRKSQTANLFVRAYNVEDEQPLLVSEADFILKQAALNRKIEASVKPDARLLASLLANEYASAPGEMSYLPGGIGFAYTTIGRRREKLYELTDLRDNVVATVSDVKAAGEQGAGQVSTYQADVANANDYYPFGALMAGRRYKESDGYRYGYNGKENDNEIKGEGGQQDYGRRVYDPRIAKFLSVDPITSSYPELTPYQFASNSPIQGIDLDGEEVKFVTTYYQGSTPKFRAETQYGIMTKGIGLVVQVHKYQVIDAQRNYHFYTRPTPFVDHEDVAPTAPATNPGHFSYIDGVQGLKKILDVYGPEMARTVERMYRSETTSGYPKKYGYGVFTSGQYRKTGTGGMEAAKGHEHDPPYYGWAGNDLFEQHPEYRPLGLNPMFEGVGMSGQGGNQQVTDYPKPFIIFPTVEAAMMYKVEYIHRYNGNWARWGGLDPGVQENYRNRISKNSSRITDSLMRALENQVNVKLNKL